MFRVRSKSRWLGLRENPAIRARRVLDAAKRLLGIVDFRRCAQADSLVQILSKRFARAFAQTNPYAPVLQADLFSYRSARRRGDTPQRDFFP